MAASTLILLSNDVALNPGNPKDQCSICKRICRSNQMAIQYDSCDAWFHTKCIEMPSGCASLVCFLVLTTCLMTNLRLFPSPNKTTREDSQDAEIHILRGLKIAHLNINRLVNKLDSLKLIIEKYYFDELLHCQKLGSL